MWISKYVKLTCCLVMLSSVLIILDKTKYLNHSIMQNMVCEKNEIYLNSIESMRNRKEENLRLDELSLFHAVGGPVLKVYLFMALSIMQSSDIWLT